MIYTIGHKETYEQNFQRNAPEPTYKLGPWAELNGAPYAGGSVWATEAEAAAAAAAAAAANEGFAVYTLDADWEADTYLVEGETIRSLRRHAIILESLRLYERDRNERNVTHE